MTYTYDAYGNLKNDGTYEYIYNSANRLVELKQAGQTVASFFYNGDGDLVEVTILGTSTRYVRDWASKGKPALVETTGTNNTYNLHSRGLIAQALPSGEIQYPLYDGMRSVRQLVNAAGAVNYAQTFDPYGGLYSFAGTNGSDYGFLSLFGLRQSPLLYYNGRWYHSGTGRFIQRQPGLPNPYVPVSGLSFGILGIALLVSPYLRKKKRAGLILILLLVGSNSIVLLGCTQPPPPPTPTGPPTQPPGPPTGTEPPGTEPPTPTGTEPPTGTPDPRVDSQTGLYLPVEAARITQFIDPETGQLVAECDPVERVEGSVGSLDLNPPGVTDPSPAYAPAQAEVMIVDLLTYRGESETLNEGLGNFVALRVRTEHLTQTARDELATNLENYREPGYVYIGYAHLSAVNVTPGQTVGAGQPIGQTGNTGLPSDHPVHLDISTFYVPDKQYSGFDPDPRQERGSSSEDEGNRNFQTYNRLFLNTKYQAELIDPKLLWPDICLGTVCQQP